MLRDIWFKVKKDKENPSNINLIAVTMGDPAGIGPEIVVKAVLDKSISDEYINGHCFPLVVGDKSVIDAVIHRLNLKVNLVAVDEEGLIDLKPEKSVIYILNIGVIKDIEDLEIGKITKLGGKAAYLYIEKSVELAKKNYVKGIVTAPINKESIKLYNIPEAGHTEILSRLTNSSGTVTMFTVDRMKIFFHTRHIPLRKAIESLSVDNIYNSLVLSHKSMLSIGYKNPKLALAALNPHASDGGLFGDEEMRILKPACNKAKQNGINIVGPFPADSVFHQCLEGKYDAIVSLYHDQGHIAAKTYDFYRTVSVTLGLPFIRTSVDHGTAFDIAWKGMANPVSMVEAIISGCKLSKIYRPLI